MAHSPPIVPLPRIHLSVPHMSGHEQAFVRDAFETNWLSSVGPNLDRFEAEVAGLLGHGVHALAVSSGTAALHLVLRAIGVRPGDRVAVSTLTFVGSVWPILYCGAVPVFLDSEVQSGNLCPGLLREYLERCARRGQLPKALVCVHLYGQHADLDAIAAVCREYEVVLVEDAAESLGARYRERPTGTIGDYAILSFNGNKIITTTGGGMVLAKSADAIARMKKWANQSREPAVEYLHAELGHNYRMSNVLAGIGRGQLRVLEERVVQRRAVFGRYREALAGLPGVRFQEEAPWGTHTRWLTVLYLDSHTVDVSPTQVVAALDAEQIEARPVWRPMHTQPMFTDAEVVGGSVSERLYATGLCLPSSSSLSIDDQARVIRTFAGCFQGVMAGAR